ncbi:lipopolysaccharide biosynthesis protein [Bacillus sp. FJAT-49705]|uniref:Lipopolysaccharide biosynthesis protein n=1 Tax=Cytobacillus citreus TaxID=2833586 RepID=A0ABS5NXQ3_9BACI|nr:lipopolysaccharide biosynthesis protein [Cytobacillus citreus]MBS4192617.1 lipopolysaccharide biosynthesis protein [Cytobacillus citreus]
MNTRLKKIFSVSSFWRSIATLVSGNIGAQLLIIVTSPILTRIYSPDSFGQLAIFISLIAIFNVFSSLKYEMTIPLESNEKKVANILVLCLLVLLCTNIVFYMIVFFLSILPDTAFEFKFFYWLVPLALLGDGLYNISSYFAVRYKLYKPLAFSKMSKSAIMSFTQLGFGMLNPTSLSLLIGDILGRSFGATSIYRSMRRFIKENKKHITLQNIREVAIKYKKYPLVTSVASFINSSSLQLVPIILGGIYGSASVGLYALAQRLILSPLLLISTAIAQVYYSEAANLYQNNDKEKLFKLFFGTSKKLFILGAIPISLLFFLGEAVIGFIFGEDWSGAGEIVRILSFMFLTQFVVSPLSQTLNILSKQTYQLLWDIFRFVLIIILFAAISYFKVDFNTALSLYGGIMSFCYIILYILIIIELKR